VTNTKIPVKIAIFVGHVGNGHQAAIKQQRSKWITTKNANVSTKYFLKSKSKSDSGCQN
jgi:hypothetical protein